MNGEINEPQAQIDQWFQALQDSNENARRDALGALKNKRDVAIPRLGARLTQPGETVETRQRLAMALGEIGHADAIPYLGQALSQDQDASVRRLCIAALERIGLIEAIPHLLAALKDPDDDVRQGGAYALGTAIQTLGGKLASDQESRYALNHLKRIGGENIGRVIVQDERDAVRQAAVAALREIGDAQAVEFLCRALAENNQVGVLWNIISALGQIRSAQAIPALGQVLLDRGADETVRRGAAGALGTLGYAEAIPVLCHAFVEDKSETVRQAAEAALVKIPRWEEKADQIIQVLHKGERERADIDALAIVRAIQPPPGASLRDALMLTDCLIKQATAFEQDRRMTGILAALVIASTGGSTLLAGERVNAYQKAQGVPEGKLRALRIEIGGAVALDPLLKVLQQNLEENFQKPIAELNNETRRMWTTTIRYAQIGFLARTIMSIVLFVVGLILIAASWVMVMFGDLQTEQLMGAGVSFVSGVVSMLSTIYFGPLKEIRQSVNDLGIASAAFMAYIHRILETSHTFSFYYLGQNISFDEMEKSSQLIEDAMNDTIKSLEPPPASSAKP